VLDNPDMLIEIAEWESAEARAAHMAEAVATGAYAPLLEMLAVPFRATVIKQLPDKSSGLPVSAAGCAVGTSLRRQRIDARQA